jgi:bifunctional ADP-heptose synthase (sugar kinase/adenylyltransferase)
LFVNVCSRKQSDVGADDVVIGNLSLSCTASAKPTICDQRQHAGVVVETKLGGLGETAAEAEEGERQHEANVHAAGSEFEGLEGLKRESVIVRVTHGCSRGVIEVLGVLNVHLILI